MDEPESEERFEHLEETKAGQEGQQGLFKEGNDSDDEPIGKPLLGELVAFQAGIGLRERIHPDYTHSHQTQQQAQHIIAIDCLLPSARYKTAMAQFNLDQQAEEVTYTVLGHSDLESSRVPLSPNSLAFTNHDLDYKYNQRLLGLTDKPEDMSVTFKNNLVLYTVALVLLAILEVAGQTVLHYRLERIGEAQLNVHLVSVVGLMTGGLFILAAVRLSLRLRLATKKLYLFLSMCLSSYLILTDERILSSLTQSSYDSNHCHNAIILMLFLYLYRLVSFSYFLGVLILSIYTLGLYLTLMIAYSPQDEIVTILEFLFVVIFCILLCFNTHETEYRARNLFYRSIQEEEISNIQPNLPTKQNKGFNTEAEKLIEMCESVRKKIKTAASVVIYIDIKAKLKEAVQELDFIREKIRRGNMNEIVRLDLQRESIDEEDMEFIRQQFYHNTESDRPTHLSGPIKYDNRRASIVNIAELGLEYLGGMIEEIGVNWSFDIWKAHDVCRRSVSIIGKYLFKRWDLNSALKCTEHVSDQFFLKVENCYLANPYHNACHAADVCHSLFYFLETANILKQLSTVDISACILATLGHDIGHPGLTNRFLINSRHKFAMRYNDSSVLENMHIALMFKIMKETGRNVLSELGKEEWVAIRRLLIELILHTDMSKHFEILGSFRTWAQMNPELDGYENKVMALSMALKCADIGHAAKATELHMKWTELICEEFFSQGDREKAAGETVSMYCDRAITDVPKSQLGFLKNICIPLYDAWSGYLSCPEVNEKCLAQLNDNIVMWEGKARARRASKLPLSVPITGHKDSSSQLSEPKCSVQSSL